MRKQTAYHSIIYSTMILCIVFLLSIGTEAELPPGTWRHIERQTPALDIDSIFCGSDGSIWVGAGSAFHVLSDERWKMYSYDRGELVNHSPFLLDSSDRLYFIDGTELVVWHNNSLERYDTFPIGLPVSGAVSDNGTVVIASYHSQNGGIFLLDDSSLTRIANWRTRSVATDAEGRIWATVLDTDLNAMRLRIYDGGAWTDISEEAGFLYPVTTNEMTVQRAPDNAIWVNNLGKYGIYADGEWTFRDGGRAPVTIAFDRSGGVWGYGSRKIYRLDGTGLWKEITTLTRGTAYSSAFLAATPDSSIWSFDGNKVYRFDGYRFQPYENKNDLATNLVTSLSYTLEGDLICGHGQREVSPIYRLNQGLSMRIDGEWVNGKEFDDVEFKNVFQFKTSPDDEVVAYTDGGFKTLYRRQWEKIDSLFVGNQTDMAWKNYTMWITTTRGLIEWVEGPEFEFYFPLDGDIVYPLNNLTIDSGGVLYMQTESGDIVTYDGTEWFTVVRDDGFTNDFAVTDDGTLWAARQRSLSRWNRNWEYWIDVEDLNVGRAMEIDPEGRIWASSYGKTGYIENGTWHRIHELDGYSSDVFAFSEDGRIAVNVFDNERENFYGIYEFEPSTSVSRTKEAPEAFLTARSWPNPFNNRTAISFELPSAVPVRIDIYSLSGQRIATLADRVFPPGRNSVIWDAGEGGETASGLYFYRIRAGDRWAGGKMLLLK